MSTTILIVENDLTVSIMIRKAIISIDPQIQISQCTNKTLALAEIANSHRPFDLIISELELDPRMPEEMAGAIIAVMARAKSEDTKFILTYSRPVGEKLRDWLTKNLAHALLQKPFQQGQISDMIRVLLNRG